MPNKKLSNQQIGLFQITERIGELAYRLKLPLTMKIHLVVSIAQLEPAEKSNLYNKRRLDHPGPVEIKDTDHSKSKNSHNKKQQD